MEIIHNSNNIESFSLNTIRGGKRHFDTLQVSEKELIQQLSETFTIVHGGQFKKRRQIA